MTFFSQRLSFVCAQKYLEPNKEKKAFTPEEIRKIFANIQSIRKMSTDMLEGLRNIMDNWTNETTIGDLFIRMVCHVPASSTFLIHSQYL